MSAPSILLNWLLLFPFVAAAVVAVFPRLLARLPPDERPSAAAAPAALVVTVIALCMAVCIALARTLASGAEVYVDYWWTPDFFQFRLRLDPMGVYFLLALLAGMLLAALWAAGERVRDHRRWAGFAAAVGALSGVVLAADLVALYIFWELSALAVWAALMPEFRPGRRYLAWNYAGGMCLLLAMVWVAALAQDTHIYSAGSGLLIHRLATLRLVGVLLICGLAVKLALGPAHLWLTGMTARAPSSWHIALPGLTLVVGAYGATRLVFFLLPGYAAAAVAWLPILLGTITVAYAGARALLARDMGASAGYLFAAMSGQVALGLGVGMRGSAAGMGGAAALAAPLALAVPLLAAVVHGARVGTWSEAAGRFRTAPALGVALVAGAWALAGLPPLGGWWAQRHLVAGAWQAGPAMLGAAGLIAPAVALAYGLRGAVIGFGGADLKSAPPLEGEGPEPAWRLWWVCGALLMLLLGGIAPGAWAAKVLAIARALVGG